jgi:hypothetical protein
MAASGTVLPKKGGRSVSALPREIGRHHRFCIMPCHGGRMALPPTTSDPTTQFSNSRSAGDMSTPN